MAEVKSTSLKKWQSRMSIYIVISTLLLALLSISSFVIILVGMLPSFLAGLMDRSMSRLFGWCVASLNLAGVFPYLLDLWLHGGGLDYSLSIVTSLDTIFTIYISALLGWLLYFISPVITKFMVIFLAQKKVKKLPTYRSDLIAEWGEEVTGSDKIQRTMNKRGNSFIS